MTTPLENVKGIGPRRSQALAEVGCRVVEDLLLTRPFRYEDRSRFAQIEDLSPGQQASVRGKIQSSFHRRVPGRSLTLFQLRIQDETGSLTAIWFNQPFLRRILKNGREVILFGESVLPTGRRGPLQFRNPQFEIVGKDPEKIHTGRIVPIYRKTAGLSSRQLRTLIHHVLNEIDPMPADPLPPEVLHRLALPAQREAFKTLHFPGAGWEPREREAARRRLALSELQKLQVELSRIRKSYARSKGLSCAPQPGLEQVLPFSLTRAQRQALAAIEQDLCRPHPMCRLLQGDVGSGKTVVAFLAACLAVRSGFQVAMMVPTEILAAQQSERLIPWGKEIGCRVGVLTSGLETAPRRKILSELADGGLDLVVGTQALIQKHVNFRKLGLVIVDEQQRFGVRQRAKLREKGRRPHLLLMTATPIPRSLALTVYGDLDFSVMDQFPPGRAGVETFLRRGEERPEIYDLVRREASAGHRIAIVYPAVRSSESMDLAGAVEEWRRLSEGPLRGLGIGLLHGQMPWEEKRGVLSDFATGKIQVLVTTTVLEVGIDVPEARVLLVEHADRFGLSQLHQLRGRVGRGGEKGLCILIPAEPVTEEAEARLRALTEIADGFKIAERDLELRGPGEFTGLRQSGEAGLRMVDLARDLDLVEEARAMVKRSNEPNRTITGRGRSRPLPLTPTLPGSH